MQTRALILSPWFIPVFALLLLTRQMRKYNSGARLPLAKSQAENLVTGVLVLSHIERFLGCCEKSKSL